MLRIPYLPGESDMDQLKTIFRALGTPTEEEWPVGHIFQHFIHFFYFLKKTFFHMFELEINIMFFFSS